MSASTVDIARQSVESRTNEWTADELRWLRAAVVEAILNRRRTGKLTPAALHSALTRIDALTCAISDSGSAANRVAGQSDQWISTDQAAALIGCTPRRVRQIAPQLGGKQVGRRWLVKLAACEEHTNGRD